MCLFSKDFPTCGNILGCAWNLVTILSKLGCNLLRGRIQPTYIGVIIYLPSTMDIPVPSIELPWQL